MAQSVPDISGVLSNLLGGIQAGAAAQDKRRGIQKAETLQRQILGEADILASGVGGKKEEAALIRLSALNPQVGNAMRQALERGDAQELAAANAEAEKGFKEATFLQNQKTFGGKRNALISLGRAEAAREGGDPSRILKLLDLPEEKLNTEIQRMLTMGQDIKVLTKPITLGPEQRLVSSTGGEIATGIGRAPTTPIAKINPKDFTPKSLQKFEETGKASDLRTVPEVEQRTNLAKNLELAGIDPKSVEGKKIIRESITKPGVKIDLNKGADFKIPIGFRPVKENGLTVGVEPVPGGPKDNLTGETAGKTQSLRGGLKAAENIEDLIFDKDGSLNNLNLFNAFFGTIGTDGRELATRYEVGIQAITRNETGAAMPPEEIENTRLRFQPSIFDSVKTARLKIQMFREFMSGTLKLLDPTGRFNAERFDIELTERGGTPTERTTFSERESAPAGTDQPIVVDF